MARKSVSAKRGRPPTVFIDDPQGERERGEYIALMRQRKYECELLDPGAWRPHRPMQPTCELDRGLVYARHAGHVAPQAVRPLANKALAFREWIVDQRAARGPERDIEMAVKLFLAIRTVAAIRRKSDPHERVATPREVAQVLELLDGVAQKPNTIKKRMARLRPHLEGFAVTKAAEGKPK